MGILEEILATLQKILSVSEDSLVELQDISDSIKPPVASPAKLVVSYQFTLGKGDQK